MFASLPPATQSVMRILTLSLTFSSSPKATVPPAAHESETKGTNQARMGLLPSARR